MKEELDPVVKKLFATTDAVQWATEWCFIARTLGPDNLIDVGWMTGWFANAIEVAKDHERRRLLGDVEGRTGQHQFHKILMKDRASRTEVDKVMIAAVMLLSTMPPYAKMAPEEVFDHFVKEHDEIYKVIQ